MEIAAPVCTGHGSGRYPEGMECATEAVMELVINGMSARVPNGTDPALLACAIRALRADIC